MIIATNTGRHFDHKLRLFNFAGRLTVGLFALLLLVFYCFYPWKAESEESERALKGTSSISPYCYESIGSGALALNPNQALGWVSHIAKELLIIAHNNRPHTSERDAKILMSLKSGKDQKSILNGKTLFLKEEEKDHALSFSEGPEALWIKPILLDNGGVLVEVGRKLGSVNPVEEKSQYVVQPNSLFSKGGVASIQEFAHSLKKARCSGQDLFVQRYGGKEFRDWKEKYKIEFADGQAQYACFVATGDYLQWVAGAWKEVSEKEISLDQPLLYVKSASPKGVELTAWDETGFYPVESTLPIESPSKLVLRPELTPSSMRLRTATQVSCLLGKKRVILRQGDWVLKTSSGWRVLRKKEEIENYLAHRLKGELFTFDELLNEQGKWILKGQLFNDMRSSVIPLSLPIDMEKKTQKAQHKRQIPLRNLSAREKK